MPTWVEHAVWWHVYPLGFVGAQTAINGDPPVHRLGQLERWFDYAVKLGASGLALGPIFESGTHGYDTIDHYRIDRRLGDGRDFEKLLDAAHERGLRVLLDGVFNHVGRDFPAFRRAVDQRASSAAATWFRRERSADWTPGSDPEYATFEGHQGLVALNHDEPAVADYVAAVMRHWLSAGVDGWRLDAAYAVPREFWATVLPRVRAGHPDAYFVGEVIHGDYSAIVRETGLNSATQYELWKAVWSSLNDRNLFELAWALDRHSTHLASFVPLTFIGNHDVTRIATRLTDSRHLPHALVVLLTVGGTPSIYYGDEQAFRGVKEERVGGDDAIRPSFPEDGPEGLAPYGWPIYRLHQELIGLRRRHPWLHRARTSALHLANSEFVYETSSDSHRLVVALNLGDSACTVAAPGTRTILAGEASVHNPGHRNSRITVPAHGWAIAG